MPDILLTLLIALVILIVNLAILHAIIKSAVVGALVQIDNLKRARTKREAEAAATSA